MQSNRIPLALTCNCTLPNVEKEITNNCNFFHIKQEFQDVFQEPPMLVFRKNRNLYLLGCQNWFWTTETIQEKNNFFSLSVSQNQETYFISKFYTHNLLKAVWHKKNRIFHDLSCKSKLLIYLTRCRICRIQYIGKSETEFNIRLNNLRKDVNRQSVSQAYLHFKLPKSTC